MTCSHACTCTHGVKFLRSAVRSGSDSADGKTMNIFITQNSHGAAVPALISQLAILEALMSFHPGHSGLDRGHAEFKGYSLRAVILPAGVYFHYTDQCFRPEGSVRDCSSFRIETLIVMKMTTLQGY